MITSHTLESLRAFEKQIAEDFNAGRIRAPVHLAGGCEEQLLGIFAHVRERDWVLTQWRSHYHCLLKGVPPERLREDILAGRSITLNYPDYRIVSSAIVGGVLPIAVGIALTAKMIGADDHVWVFVGDMTQRTGMFSECARYAAGHGLPITFVVEDNGMSVCTSTDAAWGLCGAVEQRIVSCKYSLPWPHSGAGVRVEF